MSRWWSLTERVKAHTCFQTLAAAASSFPLRQPTPAGRIPPFMFDSWYELLFFTASDTCGSETEHTYKESRCVTLWTAPFSPLVVRRVPPARPVCTQKQQPRRCNGRYQISFSPSESLDKTTQLIPRGRKKWTATERSFLFISRGSSWICISIILLSLA